MSVLSDLFEGNFSQIPGDFTSPSAISEYEDIGLGLGAGALALTGIGALGDLGLAADLGLGATTAATDVSGAGLAADLGLGDIGTAAAADTAATAADVGGTGLAADLGIGDIGSAAAADTAAGADVAALTGDTSAFGLGSLSDISTDPAIAAYAADSPTAADVSAVVNSVPDSTSSIDLSSVNNAVDTGTNSLSPSSSYNWTSGDISGQGIGSSVTADPSVTAYENPSFQAPSALSSITGALSSPYTKLALGALPLALTLGMGEQQLPAAAQALQAQALQMQQTGLANLAQAQAGILNAGQTAQIATMQQNLTNQWLQTLANQGVQDPTKDTRWPQITALIDQQVTAATAQLIQQNITNALAETGQASAALTSIAQMQMTADQNFTNALIGATKSLGLVAGLGAAPKVTVTT
jgi:hypothetical protein